MTVEDEHAQREEKTTEDSLPQPHWFGLSQLISKSAGGGLNPSTPIFVHSSTNLKGDSQQTLLSEPLSCGEHSSLWKDTFSVIFP